MHCAHDKACIQRQHLDDSDTKAKEASPGPLKSEKEWVDLESKFINDCSTIVGVNGMPLRYVIKENYNPPVDSSSMYVSSIEKKIYHAPLTGTFYDADK